MSDQQKKEIAALVLAGMISKSKPTADETTHGKYAKNGCGSPGLCGIEQP